MSKWPISLDDITRLQIELTSFCNANCPSCERYNYQYDKSNPYSRNINQNYISLSNFQRWFNYPFKKLQRIHFCGNIDEPTLNPDILKICFLIEINIMLIEIYIYI